MRDSGKIEMTIERKPVAYGDLRGWIDALKAAGELQEIDAEVDPNIELGTIMRLAQGPGTGPALLFNNIKGYNTPDKPLPPDLRLRAEQLPPHRHDARASARDASARAGQDRAQHPAGDDRAADRQDRPLQGKHHRGKGRRSRSVSLALLEPARRRPLHHHLCRRRHQGPRHQRDECRHLSRHGGRPQHDPDPDVARATYRPSRNGLAARRQEGNADRGRDRLGAVAGLLRRLAGSQRHLRIRRDGRRSAASRSISSNARRTISTCRLRPRS